MSLVERSSAPITADVLADIILTQCTAPEDGLLGHLLAETARRDDHAAREALRRPEVQIALALRISATDEDAHGGTAALLRVLRCIDGESAARIVGECDITALARTLSYVMDYSTQQVILLAGLYACNAHTGRKAFRRCGPLLKEFLAQSPFPYLDLPEELKADVEHWKARS